MSGRATRCPVCGFVTVYPNSPVEQLVRDLLIVVAVAKAYRHSLPLPASVQTIDDAIQRLQEGLLNV